MVIVAGHITVESQERESLRRELCEHGRTGSRAVGCLDLAISADLVDPGRVNIFER